MPYGPMLGSSSKQRLKSSAPEAIILAPKTDISSLNVGPARKIGFLSLSKLLARTLRPSNPHRKRQTFQRPTTSNAVSFPEICSTPAAVPTRDIRVRRASNKSNQMQTLVLSLYRDANYGATCSFVRASCAGSQLGHSKSLAESSAAIMCECNCL